MKTPTKVIVYGGIATVLLGPPLVIGTGVSIAGGAGTFSAGALKDMLPAFVQGFQTYTPGETEGLFGEDSIQIPDEIPAPGSGAPGTG